MRDTINDEVNDFHRRIYNAQSFGHLGEGSPKELIVELHDDSLLALRIVNSLSPFFDACIELLESTRLLFQGLLFQQIDHLLHGNGDWVVLGELVAFK